MPSLRIELVGNAIESAQTSKDVNNNKSERNDKASLLLQLAQKHEDDEVDSIARLKERLQLAEMSCARLQQQFQKYRLRWLEESYRVRMMKEYAPSEISICSPHQIAWEAPSPTQSEYEFDADG
ncbi:hypothetical protein CY34DRAFT_108953 [Suillus luteus UH-Slu-Lm8-n1]|uniref:Uncharacterized protein n=1 Tax=Suillus luteus UH-Slu-Lm8-n1 TaxID=930992 RepID=A0A0C9ZJX2_9AGAM|nr:hypothetical protein CY34DRAFT_108953 [Suillus luteus UH-Slu-Lm8-n1]